MNKLLILTLFMNANAQLFSGNNKEVKITINPNAFMKLQPIWLKKIILKKNRSKYENHFTDVIEKYEDFTPSERARTLCKEVDYEEFKHYKKYFAKVVKSRNLEQIDFRKNFFS